MAESLDQGAGKTQRHERARGRTDQSQPERALGNAHRALDLREARKESTDAERVEKERGKDSPVRREVDGEAMGKHARRDQWCWPRVPSAATATTATTAAAASIAAASFLNSSTWTIAVHGIGRSNVVLRNRCAHAARSLLLPCTDPAGTPC